VAILPGTKAATIGGVKLEFEFDYRVILNPPVEIAAAFYGKRIDGVLEGGSDWMIEGDTREHRHLLGRSLLPHPPGPRVRASPVRLGEHVAGAQDGLLPVLLEGHAP
jgi:hypothetical protein